MRQIVLRKRAQLGLEQIIDTTAADWGDAKAVELVRSFQRSFMLIAESPKIGRSLDGENFMMFTMSKLPFIIIYQVSIHTIRIVKILHTKRNR